MTKKYRAYGSFCVGSTHYGMTILEISQRNKNGNVVSNRRCFVRLPCGCKRWMSLSKMYTTSKSAFCQKHDTRKYANAKPMMFEGKLRLRSEIAKMLGLSASAITDRIQKTGTIDKPGPRTAIHHNGLILSVQEWADKLGFTKQHISFCYRKYGNLNRVVKRSPILTKATA